MCHNKNWAYKYRINCKTNLPLFLLFPFYFLYFSFIFFFPAHAMWGRIGQMLLHMQSISAALDRIYSQPQRQLKKPPLVHTPQQAATTGHRCLVPALLFSINSSICVNHDWKPCVSPPANQTTYHGRLCRGCLAGSWRSWLNSDLYPPCSARALRAKQGT